MNVATRTREGVICLLVFIGAIIGANYLIGNHGTVCVPDGPCLIPVWPGWLTPSGAAIMAPSGVLAIGIAFTARDLVQRRLGVRFAALAVVIGAALSAFLDPALALASGAAFLLSELLDLGVYTPLQRHNLTLAVIGSNIVGIVVDSVLFLTIAFGSIALVEGQIIGKAWMTLAAIPIVHLIRLWDARRGMIPADLPAV